MTSTWSRPRTTTARTTAASRRQQACSAQRCGATCRGRFKIIVKQTDGGVIYLGKIGEIDTEDERHRLREGDTLLRVDGAPVDRMSLEQACRECGLSSTILGGRSPRSAEQLVFGQLSCPEKLREA